MMHCHRTRYAALAAFALLAATLAVHAGARAQTVYYLDPAGSDANDGRSPQSAWRTVAKANAHSWTNGEALLLKRGGVWLEELEIGNVSNIWIGAFGSGPKPVLEAGRQLTGWSGSGPVFTKATSDPGRLWVGGSGYTDGTEYTVIGADNGDYFEGSTDIAGAAPGSYFYDGTTLSVKTGGSAPQNVWASDAGRNSFHLYNVSHARITGLEFRRANDGVFLSNVDNSRFDSCSFCWGTSGYGLTIRSGSDYDTLSNCTVDRHEVVVHAFQWGGGYHKGNRSDNISFKYGNHWEIYGCKIYDAGHSGLSLGTVDPGETCNANHVHDNEFWQRVGDYGRPIGWASPNSGADVINHTYQADSNVIERNFIHNWATHIQIQGAWNRFQYNVFDTTRTCEPVNYGWNSSHLSIGYALNTRIQNNFFGRGYDGGMRMKRWTDNSRTRIENNIFLGNGRGNPIYENTGNNPAIVDPNVAIWVEGRGSYNPRDTIRNNLMFPNTLIYDDWCTATPIPIGSVRVTGGDVFTGNITGNPLVKGDYTLAPNSPAIDAGRDVGLTEDYFGHSVPYNKAPDIGAFEAASSAAASVDEPAAPLSFSLSQNYPNPCNPSTTIRFTVAERSSADLVVYDALGREVARLLEGEVEPGTHTVRFNGQGLASGIYYYRLHAGSFISTRALLLLK